MDVFQSTCDITNPPFFLLKTLLSQHKTLRASRVSACECRVCSCVFCLLALSFWSNPACWTVTRQWAGVWCRQPEEMLILPLCPVFSSVVVNIRRGWWYRTMTRVLTFSKLAQSSRWLTRRRQKVFFDNEVYFSVSLNTSLLFQAH